MKARADLVFWVLLQEMYKAGRLQMCLSIAEEEPCLTGTSVWILSHRQ